MKAVTMNKKFRGRYLHKLDEKGRLIIPKAYRDLLGLEFIIGKDVNFNCLTIYTNDEMNKIDTELDGKSSFDSEARKTLREFYGESDECTADKQGRIMLPTWLMEMAGINKDVWLVGIGNAIEVWDKDVYENRNKQGH